MPRLWKWADRTFSWGFFFVLFFFPPPCSCCLASQKASGVALLEDDNLVCGQGNGTALAPASLGDALPRVPLPSAPSHPQTLISRALMDTWELSSKGIVPSMAHLEIRGPREGCWLSAELRDWHLQVWSHYLAERGDKALGFWATSVLWGAANSPLAQVLLSLVGLGHWF